MPSCSQITKLFTNFAACPTDNKLSTIGSRAFSVSGPHMWNQLPEEITSAASLSTFQRHLKTFLFSQSFPDIIADWHFSGPCGNLNYLGHSKKVWLIDWLIFNMFSVALGRRCFYLHEINSMQLYPVDWLSYNREHCLSTSSPSI